MSAWDKGRGVVEKRKGEDRRGERNGRAARVSRGNWQIASEKQQTARKCTEKRTTIENVQKQKSL